MSKNPDQMEQEINHYLAATQNTMPLYKAPNLADTIWQRHQNKKITKATAIAASVCLLSLTFWISSSPSLKQGPSLVVKNQKLELQLSQLSNRELSGQQQMIVANWQHELELLDQNLEQEKDRILTQNLWSIRNQLLTQMIDFYLQPMDLYEI